MQFFFKLSEYGLIFYCIYAIAATMLSNYFTLKIICTILRLKTVQASHVTTESSTNSYPYTNRSRHRVKKLVQIMVTSTECEINRFLEMTKGHKTILTYQHQIVSGNSDLYI